ncbi:MAG: 2-hydroxyacid dehydrogenase [Alphaproteobacteria bacterium]
MAKPKVFVTRRWDAEVEARLKDAFATTLNDDDRPLGPDQLKDLFRGYDAVLPTVTDRITADVLAAQPLRTRIIGSYGVGFNHIDVARAKDLGIVVTNTPDVLTDCTADLAIGLMLAVARRMGEGERQVRAGAWTGWRPTHMRGTKVTGKTLGIVGLGRIGRAVARRAHHGFGMTILYHDTGPVAAEVERELGATYCAALDDLLARADFVSLHCPATPETRHLMNAERIGRMRGDAILINTARGDVIDEAALADALGRGAIAGAGLDVYEAEPKVPATLLALENVVLMPHLGSATRETRRAMGLRVIDNVSAFFAGRPPPDRVA